MSANTPKAGSATVRPSVTIVRIGSRRYVAGLYWQPLSNQRAPMQEARKIGKAERTPLVAIRRGGALQAGFVEAGRGAQVGMISLAAALASRLGKNWIAVIELTPEKFLLCACNDGAIHPQTDVVGSKEEINDRFARVHCMYKWDRDKVYLPKGFTNVAVGETLELEKVLGGSESVVRESKLQSISFQLSRRQTVLAAAIAALAFVGLGAHAYWSSLQRAKEAAAAQAAEAERARQLAELSAATKRQQTAQALDHPWSKRPALSAIIAACSTASNSLPLFLAAWQFETSKCTESQITVNYRRVPNATVEDIKRVSKQRYLVEPSLSTDFEVATISMPISVAPGGDDELLSVSQRVESLMSHFQRTVRGVRVTEVPPPPPPQAPLPGGQTQVPPPPPPPPWSHFTWQFDTDEAPDAALKGLNTAGLRLTSLSLQLRSDATLTPLMWTFSGDFYANK